MCKMAHSFSRILTVTVLKTEVFCYSAVLRPSPAIINIFMVNSAEHVILNAQTYKISRNSAFSGSDKHRMISLLLINVKF